LDLRLKTDLKYPFPWDEKSNVFYKFPLVYLGISIQFAIPKMTTAKTPGHFIRKLKFVIKSQNNS